MKQPIAIVAGAGALPWEAAKALAPRRHVIVLALEGEADCANPPSGVESHAVGYGQIGRMRKILKANGCSELLLLGAIRKRPDYGSILGDFETLKLVPRIVRAAVGGDDTIVRNVLSLMESEGFSIVSIADTVPELLAPAGRLGRHGPGEAHQADIALGNRFLDAAASFDIGQAAVVVDGRVIAVEGAEGTDAMVSRCKELRAARRFRSARGAGVLVKRPKVGQDMRADVPVVGAQTLTLVLEAGLGGIAVEAGRTIIAEREAMVAMADRAGAFVFAQ